METIDDIKEKVINSLLKEKNAKKAPKTVVAKRNKLMAKNKLTNSVKELVKQGLCGACRLPKKYCRCGRPKAMCEHTLEKFEIAFKSGMNISEACDEVGVSRTTYHEFERAHKEWKELRESWQSTPSRKARQKVEAEIKKDVKVAQWYLERKNRDEFGRDVEGVSGPSEIRINIIGKYEEPNVIDITGTDVEYTEVAEVRTDPLAERIEERYQEEQKKQPYDDQGLPIDY